VRHGPSKDSAGSAAWRICPEAPCDAGLPRLRLNWGKPVRPARRVLPLDVRHRALLVDKGRDAWQTLTAELRGVNSGSPVVRTARTSATFCHGHDSGMQLYISIVALARIWLLDRDRSNAVYRPRGLLFDSKIKQLRGNFTRATAARRTIRCPSRPAPDVRGEDGTGRKPRGWGAAAAAPHRPERPMRPAQLP
jgi:hypothetical protein